jgi:hypothetical protein
VVAHPRHLGGEVGLVVVVGHHLDGDALHDRQAEAGQRDPLGGVVGEQAQRGQPQVGEDHRARTVVAGVGGQPELQVGLDRVAPSSCSCVGGELVEQTDPAALVAAR